MCPGTALQEPAPLPICQGPSKLQALEGLLLSLCPAQPGHCCSPAQPPQRSQSKPHTSARGSDCRVMDTHLAQPLPEVQGIALGDTGEMTMSWLSLSGSADTELGNTTGEVFILSSIQAGGQLSLHLHVLPVAHCKWL